MPYIVYTVHVVTLLGFVGRSDSKVLQKKEELNMKYVATVDVVSLIVTVNYMYVEYNPVKNTCISHHTNHRW